MNTSIVLALCFFSIRQIICPTTKKVSRKLSESEEELMTLTKLKLDDPISKSRISTPGCRERITIYILWGNMENWLYRKHLEMHKQPAEMHDIYLYEQLRDHWAYLLFMEKPYDSSDHEELTKRLIEKKFQRKRQENFIEKLNHPNRIPDQFLVDYQIKESTESLIKSKNRNMEIWGISDTASPQERHFYEKYDAETIFAEIKDEVVLKARLESEIPNLDDVKKLAEHLRRYSTSYDKRCSEEDFKGMNLLYKNMYEHIIFILRNDHCIKNYEYFSYCGPAYFDEIMQAECRKARIAFSLLTLRDFQYIIGPSSM